MTPDERYRLLMRTLVILGGLAFLAIVLTACGAQKDANGDIPAGDGAPETVNSFWVKTVDGRRIPCIWASGYNRGGLSCDWSAR